jgi:hypothetical protein
LRGLAERKPLSSFVEGVRVGKCREGCPFCYENARGRANHRGHFGYRVERVHLHWRVTMALKKPSASPTPAKAVDIIIWEEALPGLPLLGEFMFSAVYDDDSPRQLPTLMLFLHEGRLTAALNDRDQLRTAFVSGDSLDGVLEALEGGLAGDSLGWRPNKPQGKKR